MSVRPRTKHMNADNVGLNVRSGTSILAINSQLYLVQRREATSSDYLADGEEPVFSDDSKPPARRFIFPDTDEDDSPKERKGKRSVRKLPVQPPPKGTRSHSDEESFICPNCGEEGIPLGDIPRHSSAKCLDVSPSSPISSAKSNASAPPSSPFEASSPEHADTGFDCPVCGERNIPFRLIGIHGKAEGFFMGCSARIFPSNPSAFKNAQNARRTPPHASSSAVSHGSGILNRQSFRKRSHSPEPFTPSTRRRLWPPADILMDLFDESDGDAIRAPAPAASVPTPAASASTSIAPQIPNPGSSHVAPIITPQPPASNTAPQQAIPIVILSSTSDEDEGENVTPVQRPPPIRRRVRRSNREPTPPPPYSLN